MSAFGSYIQKTEIDFSLLGSTGIYLISGDTGSGKSTVFDAISYALYGEVSGGSRGEKNLRSDLADQEETYVELKFEHMGGVYQIRRSPEYMRNKLRGTGKMKKLAEASLTLPDGAVIEGVSRVDERVREILKMDAKRFKSIIMIAQGDFAKLLTANSADREEILRSIFDTGVYEAFQLEASERAKGLKSSFEQSRDRLEWLFETANVADGAEKSVFEAEKFALAVEENAKLCAERARDKREEALQSDKALASLNDEKHKASEINGLFDELDAARKALDISARDIDDIAASLPQYKAALDQSESARGEFEEIYRRSKNILSGVAVYRELSDNVKALGDSKKKAERFASEISEFEKSAKALSDRKAALEKERGALRDAPETLAALTAKRAERERDKADIEKLMRDVDDINAREKRIAAAQVKLGEASAGFARASERYDALFKSFLAAQAGLLAETLTDGAPCPVCGSAIHPSPSALPASAAREDDVTAARKVRGEAETKARKLSEAITAETRLRDESRKAAEQAVKRVTGSEGLAGLSGALAGAEKDIERIDAELRDVKAKKARLDAIPENVAAVDARMAEAARGKAEREKSLSAAVERSAALSGAIEALSGSLEFASEAEARKESERCYKKYCEWAAKLESRKKAYDEKLLELSALKGKNGALLSGLKERDAVLKQKLDVFFAGRDTSGFAERKRIPLEPINSQLSDGGARSRALYEEIAALEQHAKRYIECADGILKENLVFSRLADDYRVAKTVSDLVNGAGTGEREKLSLVRYVQSRLFDTVLTKANGRFLEMSRGRFTLERSKKTDDRRQKAGLDLNVINNVTGAARAASSLSGGEMFMASLSLALGFADVIRERSGAVVVDCLFVDEGFGSLDEKTLDTVIDVLLRLSGDDKLIGMISHVEQLRERIYKQILVKRTANGSTAKVVV